MNIDSNTITIVALSLLSAFFAFNYFTNRLKDKFANVYNTMDSHVRTVFDETDRIHQRMTRLEERIETVKQQRTSRRDLYAAEDKNYYNTGAGSNL